jgi:hypothetical protein
MGEIGMVRNDAEFGLDIPDYSLPELFGKDINPGFDAGSDLHSEKIGKRISTIEQKRLLRLVIEAIFMRKNALAALQPTFVFLPILTTILKKSSSSGPDEGSNPRCRNESHWTRFTPMIEPVSEHRSSSQIKVNQLDLDNIERWMNYQGLSWGGKKCLTAFREIWSSGILYLCCMKLHLCSWLLWNMGCVILSHCSR